MQASQKHDLEKKRTPYSFQIDVIGGAYFVLKIFYIFSTRNFIKNKHLISDINKHLTSDIETLILVLQEFQRN